MSTVDEILEALKDCSDDAPMTYMNEHQIEKLVRVLEKAIQQRDSYRDLTDYEQADDEELLKLARELR